MLQFECTIEQPEASTPAEGRSAMIDQVCRLPFFGIPQQHADGYAEVREKSVLGKVFSIANRNQDHIDALVVIGSEAALSGIKALITARCDPFHNETNRATRGSKPRIYFLSETSDNDTVAATIDRLRYRSFSPLQRRFGVVVVAERDVTQRMLHLADFVSQLSLEAHDAKSWAEPPPVILVGSESVWVGDALLQKVNQRFSIDGALVGAKTLLTPAGLIPLAFLGLNCIKLLEGALAVSDNFLKMPKSSWPIEYAKILSRLNAENQGRIVAVHREVLQPLAKWAVQVEERDGDLIYVLPRDHHRLHATQTLLPSGLIHHFDVTGHRHDTLSIHAGECWDQRSRKSLSGNASRLVLPTFEIESLGRFIQGILIASALKSL